ncbi:MAG: hypothetical protein CW348_00210, partial [Thermobifida sp.]|nr:hypothetical protein [Thermobifida sp.]
MPVSLLDRGGVRVFPGLGLCPACFHGVPGGCTRGHPFLLVAARAGQARVVAATLERFGRLDILVNAAGTHKIIETDKLAPEDWNRVIGVNLTGSFFCAQAAAPIMRDQGGGKIINIGSVMSRVGMPKRVAYASSKGGVVLLTRSLAQDWGPWKINVNAIAPGFFRTAMNEQLFQDQAWVDHLVGRIA